MIFLMVFFLLFSLSVSLYHFNQFYISLDLFSVKLGYIIILFFTFLIIARYMFLLFFALLQTLYRTSDQSKRGKEDFMPWVTIIVPAYNEEVVIGRSIESLLRQTYKKLEILIIDDGSKDATYRIASRYVFKKRLRSLRVFRKKNGGKSRAINYGIERACGELIVVVDADSKLHERAIDYMVRHFEDPTIAAVAGSVYITNQVNILTKLQALEYIEGLNMVRNGQAFLKAVNIIPGPIGMFRKGALYRVGLYDHDTFAEDCDVTLKLIAKGYKIDFEPDAIAYTEAPEELLDLIKQRYRWTRGILQAIKKHKRLLYNWHINKTGSFVMWYMLFESIFWPSIDIWANYFILYLSITQGASLLIFYWWIIFSIMDMSAALFCILVTNERLSLAFYALIYRLGFIEIVNLAKIFSTLEEFAGIRMGWGKLERKGRL